MNASEGCLNLCAKQMFSILLLSEAGTFIAMYRLTDSHLNTGFALKFISELYHLHDKSF